MNPRAKGCGMNKAREAREGQRALMMHRSRNSYPGYPGTRVPDTGTRGTLYVSYFRISTKRLNNPKIFKHPGTHQITR
eukprot:881875-Rhodomonas_salina.2